MKINIVYGPPASGKTTYVLNNKTENTLIYDFDKLMRDISGLEIYERNENIISYLVDFREQIVKSLKSETRFDEAWLIISYPKIEFVQMLDGLSIDYHLMNTDKETCKQRIDVDNDRQDKELWKSLID